MQQPKIPTIVGLLLVGLAVMVFRFAFDRVSPYLTRATTNLSPQQVTFSNITDSSFTVSWLTSEPATGGVTLEGNQSPLMDDRLTRAVGGAPNTNQQYRTHSVTVRSLKPATLYTFTILSGNKSHTNNGRPFEVQTAPAITGTGTTLEPAYGQVVTADEKPAEGALVYLTLENGQVLSSLANVSGSWVIPLNLVRSSDLTRYIESAERIDASILVRTEQGEATALTDTLNDNPVPVMTLGKTYDFRKIQASAPSPSPIAQNNPSPAVLGVATNAARTVTITKPAQGSAVPSDRPLIQGTGIPGKQVLIVLGIQNPTTASVTVGADGIWRHTPAAALAPGKQSVTISTVNANNKPAAITHTFEILKSGTQVLGDATPSGTLAPTPTEIIEDPTPTATLSGEPLPQSGNELPLILMLIVGGLLLIGGTAALLL